MSRKLSIAETHYPTQERELLALVYALTRWQYYLLTSHIEVFSDNVSLKYLRTQANLSDRQVRWLSKLEKFNFEIHHIAGKNNTAADALSRINTIFQSYPAVENDVLPNSDEDWIADYHSDPSMKPKFLDALCHPVLPYRFSKANCGTVIASLFLHPAFPRSSSLTMIHSLLVTGGSTKLLT